MAVVSAVGLTKRFGDLTAVSDLSFELEAGSVTGFLGPNGAGKTTTLRMLLGLARPTRGQALVFGRPFTELEHPAARVGAVLEASDLHPGRTGRDHLRVLALAAGVPESRIKVQPYLAGDHARPASVRLSYLRVKAVAPQCGLWPEEVSNTNHNPQYHNFGCASQQNLAAVVDNPLDLLYPRGMTPADAQRREAGVSDEGREWSYYGNKTVRPPPK